jgi:hypothetical protein
VPFPAPEPSDEPAGVAPRSQHPLPRPTHRMRRAGEERFVVEWQADDEVPTRDGHEGSMGSVVVSLRS